VGKPTPEGLAAIRPGTLHVGFLNPFQERDLVADLAKRGIRTVSMEMMPRSTIAQKMDALSSQHSLAGYYMVLLAAERLGKALPMMMTPAGTIQPARVFVIGAGVAGLQAIATAKRLGARVEAFDTRPVVAEQVQSLGARFLEIDLGETGQTDQGYAKALTPEQEALQRQGMVSACARADIVITTAQLFGRPAPRVVTREMLAAMRPGTVVVDYAVESGGNVEGSVPGEEVRVEGVRVVGLRNYPGRVALDASRMYANNLYHFVASLWDADAREMAASGASEEILAGALITDGGAVVHPMVREHYGMED
jgi:NAD(P) transhydrogenase subunit alpha